MREILLILILSLHALITLSFGVKPISSQYHARLFAGAYGTTGPSVHIYKTSVDISTALCNDIAERAKEEITKKGSFFIAVPGGSVLKLLSGMKTLSGIDWSKVYLFYVNHKCIPNSDPSATHFKAKSLFLDAVKIPESNVICLAEGLVAKGHDTDAHVYESKLRELLPRNNGLPEFDYMLIGAGKDGHIGSLYPDRKEVLSPTSGPWVLSVDKVRQNNFEFYYSLVDVFTFCLFII
jgi:6-phosphogluconolactonase